MYWDKKCFCPYLYISTDKASKDSPSVQAYGTMAQMKTLLTLLICCSLWSPLLWANSENLWNHKQLISQNAQKRGANTRNMITKEEAKEVVRSRFSDQKIRIISTKLVRSVYVVRIKMEQTGKIRDVTVSAYR